MCSSSPDTTGINRAAEQNVQLSKDALDWYKTIYADEAPDRAAASATAREQSALQRQLSLQSLSTQQDERDRYKSTFQPIEAKIAADALNYDTPQRREQEAGQAMADVDSQLALQRDGMNRDLSARGVDPGSGNAMLALSRQGVMGATAKAAAGNTARQRIETVGAAKMMDAAGIGRGVIGNQATQAQIGLQSGNSSINAAGYPVNLAQNAGAQVGQGFNTAIQANTSAGSLYGQAANIQTGVNASNDANATAAGSAVAGIAIAI